MSDLLDIAFGVVGFVYLTINLFTEMLRAIG